MKKTKLLINNMIKKDRKLLWIIPGIILVIILIMILFGGKASKLEKDLLLEQSENMMVYMDSIVKSDEKDLDSYILYALEYAYNEDNKESLTCKEIKKYIETIFDKNVSVKDINNMGVTPLLMDKGVVHMPDQESYQISRDNITQRQIATIPIVTYQLKSIKKKRNKFTVNYTESTIENPYEILNYYSDLNNDNTSKKKSKKKEETYDTSKIMNYLKGKGKIKDVKLAVNDKVVKAKGKVTNKNVTVTYILKGTQFKISKVK